MSYIYFKRFFDILLSLFFLIFFFPFFIIIALIIYFQDKGSPFFVHERIGKNGNKFLFYKFRSMQLNNPIVESHETHKLKITPFGRFIRRTNLDELPQLYNVLKGDMSLIGPRPPIPSQIELIELRRSNGSLNLIPGLTGWAQVNSFDGMSVRQKCNFDGEYAKRISFRFDFLILFKTFAYLSRKPPVY
jgi:O-antigen biosynthesis protein WbqP